MPFIPHTPDETAEMLSVIGVRTLDDLFADIPQQMRPAHFNLPKGLSEAAVCGYFENLAARNRTEMVSFLGAGFYAHKIPAAVDALSGRSEFYTAYTPYQAECSQGTLQAIFEYQTAVCRLLDMDCANASVYDGGSALFEACMTAVRVSRRKLIVVDECVNPIWRVQLGTYTSDLDVDVRVVPQRNGTSDKQALMAAITDQCAAVVVQNPNFFGVVDDFSELFAHARSKKALGRHLRLPDHAVRAQDAGRDGGGHRRGRRAEPRPAAGLRRPLSGHHGLPQGAYPPVPRPHRRPHPGFGRQDRLRADPSGPRAAHPPRQGHVQHLLQSGRCAPCVRSSIFPSWGRRGWRRWPSTTWRSPATPWNVSPPCAA